MSFEPGSKPTSIRSSRRVYPYDRRSQDTSRQPWSRNQSRATVASTSGPYSLNQVVPRHFIRPKAPTPVLGSVEDISSQSDVDLAVVPEESSHEDEGLALASVEPRNAEATETTHDTSLKTHNGVHRPEMSALFDQGSAFAPNDWQVTEEIEKRHSAGRYLTPLDRKVIGRCLLCERPFSEDSVEAAVEPKAVRLESDPSVIDSEHSHPRKPIVRRRFETASVEVVTKVLPSTLDNATYPESMAFRRPRTGLDALRAFIHNPHILGSNVPYEVHVRCEQPVFIHRLAFFNPKTNDPMVLVRARNVFIKQTRLMFVEGVIPVLKSTIQRSTKWKRAALCHEEVIQANNLGDRAFPCYRGIQTLVSYLHGSGHEAQGNFEPSSAQRQDNLYLPDVPSIIALQDFFEDGFKRMMRVGRSDACRSLAMLPFEATKEKYKIRGTQKPINIFHAWVILQSKDVMCEIRAYGRICRDPVTGTPVSPTTALFRNVSVYFGLEPRRRKRTDTYISEKHGLKRITSHLDFRSHSKDYAKSTPIEVLQTDHAPVLLWAAHRTLVIVGTCYTRKGKQYLIVFDPGKATPEFVRKRAHVEPEKDFPDSPDADSKVEDDAHARDTDHKDHSWTFKKCYLRSMRHFEKYSQLSTLMPLDEAINEGSWDLHYNWTDLDGSVVWETAINYDKGTNAAMDAELARPPSPSATMRNRRSGITLPRLDSMELYFWR